MKVTNKKLSQISQKWHCCPKSLTPEEINLLPVVKEWENDINIIDVSQEEEEEGEVLFENLFFAFYGIKL